MFHRDCADFIDLLCIKVAHVIEESIIPKLMILRNCIHITNILVYHDLFEFFDLRFKCPVWLNFQSLQ